MGTTEKVRVILTALGYTLATLAEDTGMSQYKAKRILKDTNYEVRFSGLVTFCKATGITPNTLYRDWKGGVMV